VTSQALSEKTLRRHIDRPDHSLLSVQVMGNDVAQMAEATALVARAGADIVDINLGCPAPKAVRKGVGSAMLKDLELMTEVVSRMRERTTTPLSAKIRAGFDDSSRVLTIAHRLEAAGVDFLTVHPRRRVDFYSGVADWRIIRLLSRELHIPVIGNGDIWYAADAFRIVEETGCQGVMLGRPALRNPWIFEQIDSLKRGLPPPVPSGADVIAHLRELAEVLAAATTSHGLLGLLKEQVRYLGRAVRDGGAFSAGALRSQNLAALWLFLEQELRERPAAELDLGPMPGGLEKSGSAVVTALEPDASHASDLRSSALLG